MAVNETDFKSFIFIGAHATFDHAICATLGPGWRSEGENITRTGMAARRRTQEEGGDTEKEQFAEKSHEKKKR